MSHDVLSRGNTSGDDGSCSLSSASSVTSLSSAASSLTSLSSGGLSDVDGSSRMVEVSDTMMSENGEAVIGKHGNCSLVKERTPSQALHLGARAHNNGKFNPCSALSFADEDCPPHAMIAFIGRRREMEDAVTAVPAFLSIRGDGTCMENSILHFFGVYDGHGGAQAAVFCKDRLHKALEEEVNSNGGSCACPNYPNWNRDWERAMISSFLRVDSEITGPFAESECMMGEDSEMAEKNPAVPLLPETVGSTAVVAVVGSHQIIVANCGDSRAVLSRSGKAIALSNDHKPEREDELARVEAAGGRVIHWNGYRVLGVLSMSRALGDRYLKPFVIAVPEVRCMHRTMDDEFLILASDGLWDVLSNEAACDVVRMCFAGRCNSKTIQSLTSKAGALESRSSIAAAFLTQLALARGSNDNISVVVIDLKGRK